MATKYCDLDLTTGGNTGADWANAWKTWSDLATNYSAGDTVLVRGSETQGAQVTLATNGTAAAPVVIIGVGSDGTVTEGDRPALNGNGAYWTVYITGDYISLENFTLTNGTTQNCRCDGDNCNFYNIDSSGVTYGIFMYRYSAVRRCQLHGNTIGYSGTIRALVEDCAIYNNTNQGLYLTSEQCAKGCLVYDNGTGVDFVGGAGEFLFDCTIVDNTTGISDTGGNSNFISYCIITNNTTGLSNSTGATIGLANRWYLNGTKISTTANYYDTDANGVLADVDLGADPYDDRANDDYGITYTDSDLMELAVIKGSLNTSYQGAGALIPQAAAAGGGNLIDGSLII